MELQWSLLLVEGEDEDEEETRRLPPFEEVPDYDSETEGGGIDLARELSRMTSIGQDELCRGHSAKVSISGDDVKITNEAGDESTINGEMRRDGEVYGVEWDPVAHGIPSGGTVDKESRRIHDGNEVRGAVGDSEIR